MNRIKPLRIANDMKQIDLASRLNVRQTTISHWENGKTEPDMESLKLMASLFGVSIDYLLGIDAKKEPTTVSGGGQAEKLASALGAIGIDVDNLTEAEISRIARLAKAALEE